MSDPRPRRLLGKVVSVTGEDDWAELAAELREVCGQAHGLVRE